MDGDACAQAAETREKLARVEAALQLASEALFGVAACATAFHALPPTTQYAIADSRIAITQAMKVTR
jgi:hypothetical protein